MESTSQEIETATLAADERPKRSKKDGEKEGEKDGSESSKGANGASYSAQDSKNVTQPLGDPLNIEISVRSLLEAGVHFGHQTSRWNPAMAPYIYTVRNGIHIISLPRTVQCWTRAQKAIIELVGQGGSVLFVGTKKQAQDAVAQEATRCGAFYVSKRWLGGMLTNFGTIRRSVDRMKKVEEIIKAEEDAIASGTPTKFTKKERLMYTRELEKLNFSIGGIKNMTGHPQLLFVVDVKREDIAIKEARRLDIPVVALVDTNCDPAGINFPIPSNDDGSRAVRIFAQAVADAVIVGKRLLEENLRTGKVVLQKPQPVAAPEKKDRERPEGGRGPGKGGRKPDQRTDPRATQGRSQAAAPVAAQASEPVAAPLAEETTETVAATDASESDISVNEVNETEQ